MKVQFEARGDVFRIVSMQLDELLQHAKGCHLMKQTAAIRMVKCDETFVEIENNINTNNIIKTNPNNINNNNNNNTAINNEKLNTKKFSIVNNYQMCTFPNLYLCARRISLCARRITMAVACGLKIRRFWLGKGCRARNYEDLGNFFYKGPARQFSLEEESADFLACFDRACPIDLVQEILLNHNIDGSYDHTIRMIIFRDDLKEIINMRTRIRGRLVQNGDHVTADTQITTVMKAARLRLPMFKKPSYWSDDVNAVVLIGLESSM